jgi:flagellar biosynthesis protein FlhA
MASGPANISAAGGGAGALIPDPRAAAARPKGAAGGKAPAATAVLSRAGDLVVPLSVLGIVMAMISPMPAFMLDVLISLNITVSTVVLLVSLYITRPVEFSVFPTALLLLTLFRLALNISSSRLILLHGNAGTSAAGDVIEAFGNFVVGGNYVIGVVIFLVLIAIQYVVINHGAVRISEVTARFTLDAMPGKQMSIDADLNAGLIDEADAKARRKGLAAEAEFYGAMDGASRFTQRDAIASIIITAINIIAGFLIGVLQHGMDLTRAIQTYTILTIGDGLVTVIPALMISVSGGLIVTRASSESKLGTDVRVQMFSNPQPLLLASGVLIAMAAFPGLPKIPFLLIGVTLGTFAWRMRQKSVADENVAPEAEASQPKENVEALLRVEPIAVEVGLGLVRFVEGAQNSPLLRRIAGIRRQLASDLGYLLPPVRVTDNLGLKVREYVISIKGVEVARYELPQGCDLAISTSRTAPQIEGVQTREPAFGIPAVWVSAERAEIARTSGYTVVDAVSVLGTHLSEVIRRNAQELYSRADAKKLLDRVAEENPKAVEDLVPKLLSLAVVQKVLQNLLRERVSIRDANTIVESLGEAAGMTRNPVLLTEYVRQSIRRMVVKPYLTPNGDLPAFFFDPGLEQVIESAIEHGENTSHVNLAPQAIRHVQERIARAVGSLENPTVAIAGSGSRYFIRQLVEAALANLTILSHSEIPAGVRVTSLGVIQ